MWELTIIKELKNGYIVMSPNGDTEFIEKEIYDSLILKKLGSQNQNSYI